MNNTLTADQLAKLGQSLPLLAAIDDCGSFSGAADRLDIDQSAVSHKIKDLEKTLGLTLFQRTTRKIVPTRAGRLLLNAAQRTLQDLDSTGLAIKNLTSEQTLRLSISSSLAMKWLLPLLGTPYFQNLDITIDVNDSPVSLDDGKIDACIRFGKGPYPGLFATKLAQTHLIPVANPTVVKGLSKKAFDFENTKLSFLADGRGEMDATGFSWKNYFAGRNFKLFKPNKIILFDRADLMLQAAIGGAGIALGRTLLVERDIREGLLVPIASSVPIDSYYWLLTSHELQTTTRIKTLLTSLRQVIDFTTTNNSKNSVAISEL